MSGSETHGVRDAHAQRVQTEESPLLSQRNGLTSYMSAPQDTAPRAPPSAVMDNITNSPGRSTVNSNGEREDNVIFLSTPLDFFFPCNSCFIVPEKRSVVELFFGNYHGTISEPGFYCRSQIGMELRWLNTDLVTYDMKHTKVIDARGNPVIISGIVTYHIENGRRAAIDVSNPHNFVRDQAPAVLKRIVSKYPYESDSYEVASLRTETAEISNQMRDELQTRCAVAGVRILSFNINELSYAPEIAQAMLKRQQAEALISARRAIVQGAKQIALDTVKEMGEETQMPLEKKVDLLSNLLIILVSEKEVMPTLQVS
ncbi:hypothetical protein BWQ96_03126 [Gracilariopsis chorda]|uniref:Band 7 domain-containing protein n=1 Tax=Gracilariopsis chorda TaxID=448386 RepID=A0A2V3IY59_9FLOR|nr:hypothetical protein BWQ96_03126 [Gracilariopsis chorda]|eukprot:PXF47049.1 hypothetical protein BWQ96_03126 [Gracilariopsis chorda]